MILFIFFSLAFSFDNEPVLLTSKCLSNQVFNLFSYKCENCPGDLTGDDYGNCFCPNPQDILNITNPRNVNCLNPLSIGQDRIFVFEDHKFLFPLHNVPPISQIIYFDSNRASTKSLNESFSTYVTKAYEICKTWNYTQSACQAITNLCV